MVIAVGERSTKGKIRRMVDNSKDEKITPLQEKLEVLAKRISTFAIFAGATTFLCLTIRLIFVYISDYRVYKGWGLVDPFENDQFVLKSKQSTSKPFKKFLTNYLIQ